MKLATGCTVAALWQLVGHFFPLSEPYKRPNVLRRIITYTYGTLGIMLGLWIATDKRTAATALTIATAAGGATIAAYSVDHWLNGYGRDA